MNGAYIDNEYGWCNAGVVCGSGNTSGAEDTSTGEPGESLKGPTIKSDLLFWLFEKTQSQKTQTQGLFGENSRNFVEKLKESYHLNRSVADKRILFTGFC